MCTQWTYSAECTVDSGWGGLNGSERSDRAATEKEERRGQAVDKGSGRVGRGRNDEDDDDDDDDDDDEEEEKKDDN